MCEFFYFSGMRKKEKFYKELDSILRVGFNNPTKTINEPVERAKTEKDFKRESFNYLVEDGALTISENQSPLNRVYSLTFYGERRISDTYLAQYKKESLDQCFLRSVQIFAILAGIGALGSFLVHLIRLCVGR